MGIRPIIMVACSKLDLDVLPLSGLGSLSALSYLQIRLGVLGHPLLGLLDTAMGTFGLLLAGLTTSLALFWISPPETLVSRVGGTRSGSMGRFAFCLGKSALPAALISILATYTLALL